MLSMEGGEFDKSDLEDKPVQYIVDPTTAIIDLLKSGLNDLISAKEHFSTNIIPKNINISRSYTHLNRSIHFTVKANGLIDDIPLRRTNKLPTIRMLLEDADDGLIPILNKIGSDLLTILESPKEHPERGPIIHRSNYHFILAEEAFTRLIKSFSSI